LKKLNYPAKLGGLMVLKMAKTRELPGKFCKKIWVKFELWIADYQKIVFPIDKQKDK